jgi:ADP-heptose:LPS heptosyltransferase
MHIAAAFKKPIISIWGNTIPEFGMYPYSTPFTKFEVSNLDCRPCSKLGYNTCPKGHLNCMNLIDEKQIEEAIRKEMALRVDTVSGTHLLNN